jgi:DNA-binding transcriptional ArsR family regulator
MTAPHLDQRVRRYIRSRPFGASAREIDRDFGRDGLAAICIAEAMVAEGAAVRQGVTANPTYRVLTKRDQPDPPQNIPAPEPPMTLAVSLAQPGTTIREQVLAYLTHHGESTIADIVTNTTAGSPDSVRAALPKLAKAGAIARVRDGVYDVAPGEAEQRGELAAAHSEAAALRKRLEDADREVEALEQERDRWQRVANGEAEARQAERDEARAEVEHLRIDRDAWRGQRDLALRERDEGRADLREAGVELSEARAEVDAAQDLLDEVAKDRDDAHREIAEARATIESLREEQRQDHAEFDAIDEALGFGPGTTRSEGDRVERITFMRENAAEARKSAAVAMRDRDDALARFDWKTLTPAPAGPPMPPEAVAALLDLTEHVGDAESFAALRRLLVAVGVARG